MSYNMNSPREYGVIPISELEKMGFVPLIGEELVLNSQRGVSLTAEKVDDIGVLVECYDPFFPEVIPDDELDTLIERFRIKDSLGLKVLTKHIETGERRDETIFKRNYGKEVARFLKEEPSIVKDVFIDAGVGITDEALDLMKNLDDAAKYFANPRKFCMVHGIRSY